MKKLLCALLAAVLTLTLMIPCTATDFAGFSDQQEIENNNAVRMLYDLGLISGYSDGSFGPQNPIRREEVAKLMALLREAEPQALEAMGLFDLEYAADRRFGELSGGEAQRVCVARAILKNAPILVLDEATAFADPENEYKMQQALQSLIKGKTVIIIAHRLSSIVSADNIVVLQQGRIVQQGQHDDLSVAEGLYKNMWDAYTSAYHWKLNKN